MTGTLFDLPPTVRTRPTDILTDATFSQDGRCRLTLTRTWRAGPHVCFCGINPSTADHRKNDPTVWRWIEFTEAWGYGGFVAVNLYPFRSPDIAACRKWAAWEGNGPDYGARDAILNNVDIVATEAKRAALFVACWGATTWDNQFVEYVIEEIQSGPAPWPDIYCLGKTGGGDPKHPMARGVHRVPNDQKPVLWRSP